MLAYVHLPINRKKKGEARDIPESGKTSNLFKSFPKKRAPGYCSDVVVAGTVG